MNLCVPVNTVKRSFRIPLKVTMNIVPPTPILRVDKNIVKTKFLKKFYNLLILNLFNRFQYKLMQRGGTINTYLSSTGRQL